MSGAVLLCLALAVAGGGVMAATVVRSRRAVADLDDVLGHRVHSEFDERVAAPFASRVLGAVGKAVSHRVERFLPRQYLENLDRQLAQAGLAGKRKAAEQVALQLGLAGAGAVAMLVVLRTKPPPGLALGLLLLPVMGLMLPSAGLKRKVRARSDAIVKDLPDIVDMLAIAVEAGSGFEAALSVVCANFDSPLTDELSVTLREMELGMTRKEALQRLKERADLDSVRVLVLALLQADALGIPIGKVLKTQAVEVRARRRAWAREKAAKLPVKILVPLVLFIFPPIMALVIGPAASSFTKLGG